MELLLEKLDLVVMLVGAFLGSVKASTEFDKDKSLCLRTLDVALGVFVGVMAAFHYGSQLNLWLSSLIALIGGVSGAMVVEVFMQMLPSLARKFIKGLAERLR